MSRHSARAWLLAVLSCVLVGLGLTPSMAQAATNPFGDGSAWSVPVRYMSMLAAQPNGGVIADTAIASGGVPSGGDALVGIDASGNTSWAVPYQDQSLIDKMVVDGNGTSYTVRTDATSTRLVAASGSSERWSKDIGSGAEWRLAVGADGQLYVLGGNQIYGYASSDGHELFTPVALSNFSSGSNDRLFAYSGGLIAYSAFGKVLYLDYAGLVTGGPYAYTVTQPNVYEPMESASATGDLFVIWNTEGLTPDGCFDAAGETMMAKFTPSGAAWTTTLPHVTRCNHGGPYVGATPDGGAVVSSVADSGVDVQYVSGAGVAGWHQTFSAPSGSGITSLQSMKVDASGQVLAVATFNFGCNLWSDSCSGVEVTRFGADGAALSPLLLQGDPLVNQQSWSTWGANVLALTPGQAELALLHNQGGALYGSPTYSVDGFQVAGLLGEYPGVAIWKLAGGGGTAPPPAPNPGAKVTSVSYDITSKTPRWNLDLTVGLKGVTCPANVKITLGSWTKTATACGTGQTPPSTIHYLWKVFDGSHKLTPKGTVPVTAFVAGAKDGQLTGVNFTLPDAPVWGAPGDSYSSGHHQDKDNISCIPKNLPIIGSCHPVSLLENDADFSWVTRAVDQINKNVPVEWRYRILLEARSGATTREMFEQGQIDRVMSAVAAHGRTWSVISFTGGANNLDFGGVLTSFYARFFPLELVKPWGVKNWGDCPDTQLLYNRYLDQRTTIQSDLAEIIVRGRAASPSVRFVDMLYPYVLKSDNICQVNRQIPGPNDLTHSITWHGAGSVIDAIDGLHLALTGDDIYRVDLRPEFGANPLPRTQQARYYGYPHPADSGQKLMGNLAVAALP